MFKQVAKVLDKAVGKPTSRLLWTTSEKISRQHPKSGHLFGEVTTSVVAATFQSIKIVGSILDITVDSGINLVKKDKVKLAQSGNQLVHLGTQVVRGIGQSMKTTYEGISMTAQGAISKDGNRLFEGTTILSKQVAVILFAWGSLDVIYDAATGETIIVETRNDHLTGSFHNETRIQFVTREIELEDGNEIIGVFADFPTDFQTELPSEMYLASDQMHNSYANQQLFAEIKNNPALAERLELTPLDKELLYQGNTPQGYTWHHSEQPGVLQLVDQELHANTGHTGGRELWGGGEGFRG